MQSNKTERPEFSHASSIYVGWALVLLLCAFVYWPGLGGPFLFDDFGSIADLGNLGGVRDWFTFKAYVFGGYTGPTGRPLSLLSFLIDANNWPADPWPFKRTNLIIHLLNGVLLGGLTASILRLSGMPANRVKWTTLVCAALWLLHPFLISTTLYAVQRMALLSTLFIFLGIVFYLRGRSLLESRPAKAYLMMSLALVSCTLLSMLCKENGILLPLLVLIFEFTIIAAMRQGAARLDRRWTTVFLVAPSIVVAGYLVLQAFTLNFFEPNPPRDFGTFERLLSESRILLDYLRHWFVPEIHTAGLFQDHYPKSTGFLSPLSTLASIILHLCLITICVVKRREWPLLAFAILFFYGSHLLESTVVNLELYFEHRNYLAAAFLLLPLVVRLQEKASQALFSTVSLSAILLLSGFTYSATNMWASYPAIVQAAAQKAPMSARAQHQHALILYNSQRYDVALQVVDSAIERIPGDVQLRLLRSIFLCNLGILTAEDFAQTKSDVASKAFDVRAASEFDTLSNSIVNRKCDAVNLQDLRSLFTEMLQSPLNSEAADPFRYGEVRYYVGRTDVQMGEPALAMENFAEALRVHPGASRAMHMAALMATHQFNVEALQLSEIALASLRSADADPMAPDAVHEDDIVAFQNGLRQAMSVTEDP
jgi:tetratricopeptide (TPR) repeat protein